MGYLAKNHSAIRGDFDGKSHCGAEKHMGNPCLNTFSKECREALLDTDH